MICCVMTRLSGGPRKPVTPRHILPPGAVASCLIHVVTEVSHIEGACSPAGLRLQRRGSAESHVHVGMVAVLRLLALVRSFAQPARFAVSHLGRSLSRLHRETCDESIPMTPWLSTVDARHDTCPLRDFLCRHMWEVSLSRFAHLSTCTLMMKTLPSHHFGESEIRFAISVLEQLPPRCTGAGRSCSIAKVISWESKSRVEKSCKSRVIESGQGHFIQATVHL